MYVGLRHVAAAAAVYLMLLGTGSDAHASAACPTDLAIPTAADVAGAAFAVVCDLNAVRARHGLRPLRWDWRLWAGAQRMARDVTRQRFFTHVTPDGRNLVDRVRAAGYLRGGRWSVGENLAWGHGALSSPLAIVIGWMQSASHRRNVLDPDFSDVGIGVRPGAPDGSARGMVFVANFGTLRG